MISNRSNIFGILAVEKGGYGVPFCTKERKCFPQLRKLVPSQFSVSLLIKIGLSVSKYDIT